MQNHIKEVLSLKHREKALVWFLYYYLILANSLQLQRIKQIDQPNRIVW